MQASGEWQGGGKGRRGCCWADRLECECCVGVAGIFQCSLLLCIRCPLFLPEFSFAALFSRSFVNLMSLFVFLSFSLFLSLSSPCLFSNSLPLSLLIFFSSFFFFSLCRPSFSLLPFLLFFPRPIISLFSPLSPPLFSLLSFLSATLLSFFHFLSSPLFPLLFSFSCLFLSLLSSHFFSRPNPRTEFGQAHGHHACPFGHARALLVR